MDKKTYELLNMYYEENLTLNELAKLHKVSSGTISNKIQQAERNSLFQISIIGKTSETVRLERLIEKKFGIKEVVICNSHPENESKTSRNIGIATSNYLNDNFTDEIRTIGITWGKTLREWIDLFPNQKKPNVTIVPLCGGMGEKQQNLHSNALAIDFANKFGSNYSQLYAPVLLESRELLPLLSDMRLVSDVLDQGKNVDMAFVGIGTMKENSTIMELGIINDKEVETIQQSGAIGDIGFMFFDIHGNPIDDVFNDRVIGIELEDLKKVKNVVAISQGVEKKESVLGALRGKLVDTLIIDYELANAILE